MRGAGGGLDRGGVDCLLSATSSFTRVSFLAAIVGDRRTATFAAAKSVSLRIFLITAVLGSVSTLLARGLPSNLAFGEGWPLLLLGE